MYTYPPERHHGHNYFTENPYAYLAHTHILLMLSLNISHTLHIHTASPCPPPTEPAHAHLTQTHTAHVLHIQAHPAHVFIIQRFPAYVHMKCTHLHMPSWHTKQPTYVHLTYSHPAHTHPIDTGPQRSHNIDISTSKTKPAPLTLTHLQLNKKRSHSHTVHMSPHKHKPYTCSLNTQYLAHSHLYTITHLTKTACKYPLQRQTLHWSTTNTLPCPPHIHTLHIPSPRCTCMPGTHIAQVQFNETLHLCSNCTPCSCISQLIYTPYAYMLYPCPLHIHITGTCPPHIPSTC